MHLGLFYVGKATYHGVHHNSGQGIFFPRHMGCDLVSGLKKSLLGCQPLFSFFVLAMYFDAEAGGAFGVIV